jgi:hypothetical protein
MCLSKRTEGKKKFTDVEPLFSIIHELYKNWNNCTPLYQSVGFWFGIFPASAMLFLLMPNQCIDYIVQYRAVSV